MLGLTRYRLQVHPDAPDVFDILDLESGVLVGVASPAKRLIDRILTYRLLRYGVRTVSVVLIPLWIITFPFWFVGAIFGLWPFRSSGSKSRLIVRMPDGGIILTLEVSPGLMYDSRRVYDGNGKLLAFFQSHGKATVRGGFGILDLVGVEDDGRGFSGRSSLGHVEPSGSEYRFGWLNDPDAGRITPHTASPAMDPRTTMVRVGADHFDVDASETVRDATLKLVLLAAALTVAWSPH